MSFIPQWRRGLALLLGTIASCFLVIGIQNYTIAQQAPLTLETSLLTLEQVGDNVYLIDKYPDATIVPGHGIIGDRGSLVRLKDYFSELESMALQWKKLGLSEEEAISSAGSIPEAYQDYKFQGLYPVGLKTAYEQITLK